MNTETHLLGKRESSKIQIRERLLDESLKLFSSRGLEKTTVADIVEQSGIARGTFYNYFPDVNSLFDAIISQMNGNIQTEIKANREKSLSVYDYLFATFKCYFDFIGSPQMIYFHVINQAHIRQSSYQSEIIKTIVKDLIRDLKSSKRIKDFNEKYEFLLLSFMLVGAPPELFLATHTSDINLSSEQLATFLAKVFHKVLME